MCVCVFGIKKKINDTAIFKQSWDQRIAINNWIIKSTFTFMVSSMLFSKQVTFISIEWFLNTIDAWRIFLNEMYWHLDSLESELNLFTAKIVLLDYSKQNCSGFFFVLNCRCGMFKIHWCCCWFTIVICLTVHFIRLNKIKKHNIQSIFSRIQNSTWIPFSQSRQKIKAFSMHIPFENKNYYIWYHFHFNYVVMVWYA